mmetsp:Transcript_40994/g.112747  ORF Transcript_40994/g.112747 Transcript_40994/m.112747 type:complete len:91 (-) Transcript_40994:1443-1715(-)
MPVGKRNWIRPQVSGGQWSRRLSSGLRCVRAAGAPATRSTWMPIQDLFAAMPIPFWMFGMPTVASNALSDYEIPGGVADGKEHMRTAIPD